MFKDDEIDLNLPEMKLRYKNCMIAMDGINSIFEMVGQHPADVMFVLGSIMGSTLYRHIKKQDLPDIFNKLREHAMAEYIDHENDDKLENVRTDVKH
jgi:hypothetical protein